MPTIDASGLPGYEVTIWNGFFAPAGTPREIIAKVNQALLAALADPSVVKRLTELAVDLPTPRRRRPKP